MIYNVRTRGTHWILGIVNEKTRQDAQNAAVERYGWDAEQGVGRRVEVDLCETARAREHYLKTQVLQ